ncbi:MAG: zinc-binding dehydrogenase [Actinomycetales bacterium]|nr:zinc-binding dehydrogenase [Actinomycetales bacterium]
MFAVTAEKFSPADPVAGLRAGEIERPEAPDDWTWVRVRAASLNHHDLWTLRGVGITQERLPMVLGCDAAGVEEGTGREVIVHAVIADPAATGDETTDPDRSLLSERHPGTFAELVAVPRRNLVEKPSWLSWEDAACLPVAWLTAWRMVRHRANLDRPGTVLVQGAAGGVASAAIAIAHASGHRVWATTRSEDKVEFARSLGAEQVFAVGDRLPECVDAVIETVGEATWAHSLRSLRPGGTVVVSGATSGANPPADLARVFFLQLRIIGSTMGSVGELCELVEFLGETGLRPVIDRVLPMQRAAEAFRAMAAGELLGKAVLTLG